MCIRYKRLISFLLCILSIFAMFNYVVLQAQASAVVVLGASVLLLAVTTAMIAAGVQFSSPSIAKATAQTFLDNVEQSKEAFSACLQGGRKVLDAVTNAPMYVATLSGVAWKLVQNYVNENFLVGLNAFKPANITSDSATYTPSNVGIIERNNYPYSVKERYCYTATGNLLYYYTISNALDYQGNVVPHITINHINDWRLGALVSVNAAPYTRSLVTYGTDGNMINWDLYVKFNTGYENVIQAHPTVGGDAAFKSNLLTTGTLHFTSVLLPDGSISGVSGVVDNPTYDWANTKTKEKSISWFPPVSEDGKIVLDDSGTVPGVRDLDEALDDLIVLTPSDIKDLETSGTPIADEGEGSISIPDILGGVDTLLRDLFIPREAVISDIMDGMKNFFSNRFGLLFFPIELFLDLIDRISSLGDTAPYIDVPALVFNGETLVPAQRYTFDFLQTPKFKEIHDYYLMAIDVALVGSLVSLILKKYKETLAP